MSTPVNVWYRTPAGAVVQVTAAPAPTVPDGCSAISFFEYQQAVKAVDAAEAQAAAADRAAVAENAAKVAAAVAFYEAQQAPDAGTAAVPAT